MVKRLEKILKDRKISIRALSAKTGVPVSTLSKWIAGTHQASAPALLKVARYLKVSMELLLDAEPLKKDGAENLVSGASDETRILLSGTYKITLEKVENGERDE